MKRWRGLCIGAGYFSQFHFDAWRRMDDVEIVGVCDRDEAKARQAADRLPHAVAFTDADAAIAERKPDFVDIVTRPDSHLPLVELAAGQVQAIICQKPLADDYATAEAIVQVATQRGTRLMVHENFRFQPWYREIRRLLDAGAIGRHLHGLTFRARPGDGWGENAYLARQPYFRTMPRLLVHETGVHFIDVFRFLAGEIDEVFAVLRRLNPAIVGEDAALVTCRFASGAAGVWDANRYNETTADDPRYTFGTLIVEADGGNIRLDEEGRLFIKPLGQPEREHVYHHERRGFAGDCVFATQRHFIDCLNRGDAFETSGDEYLRTLAVEEAVYESAATNRPVRCGGDSCRAPKRVGRLPRSAQRPVTTESAFDWPTRGQVGDLPYAPGQAANLPYGSCRIVDLSLPLDNDLRGVHITPSKSIASDGWNATTLTLYSHCGTHMDAPRHFLADGLTIDQMALDVCCGPAKVIDLTPVAPRELITVDRLCERSASVQPGDRLLLRTDWSSRIGTPDYRDQLPRISLELARWLVERRVTLIGVEPPSVADVNDREELTAVHQTLLRGHVVIVEGLAHLDQLQRPIVQFVALPLRVAGGDGSPVRAVAIEALSDPLS